MRSLGTAHYHHMSNALQHKLQRVRETSHFSTKSPPVADVRLSTHATLAASTQNHELIDVLENAIAAFAELDQTNSELMAVRNTLEAERAQFEELFEAAPWPYIVTDANGVIRRVNAAASRLLALGKSRLVRKPLSIFVAKADRSAFQSMTKQLFEVTIDHSEANLEMRTHKGERFAAQLGVSPIRSHDDNSILGLRWLIHDTTERYRAENEIKRLNKELERRVVELAYARDEALESSKAKMNFVANISHEMRTPLNGAIGMAEMLLQENLSTNQREFAQIINQSARQLLDTVNDVLSVSKIESNAEEQEVTEFDIHAALAEAAAYFDQIAKAKALSFSLKIGSNVPRLVQGDYKHLKRVLINLIGNAIKFTESGQVAVEAIAESEETITFAVKDTGIGISKEALERLFKPFSQADGSITRKYGGTGLGLYISQRLVQMMGGTIMVKTALDRGSTFSFSLPLTPITSDLRHVTEGAASNRAKELHNALKDYPVSILVAEDNAVNRRVAVLILQHLGLKPDTVTNGQEAVDLLRTRPYDIIFMDCQMPQLDGYSAAREIRQIQEDGELRSCIIALTAHAMEFDRQRCLDAGMDDYVSKPVDCSKLYDVLSRWLKEREGVKQAS